MVGVGEEVETVGIKETAKTTCTNVEMFRKLFDEGLRFAIREGGRTVGAGVVVSKIIE